MCTTGELKESRSSKLEYLVKWTNIEYNSSTWEEENNDQDMQEAIEKFTRRYAMAKEKACMKLTERAVAPAIKQQPKYITGGTLHGYQLQGVKWLLSNFQQRKSVILAGMFFRIQPVYLTTVFWLVWTFTDDNCK